VCREDRCSVESQDSRLWYVFMYISIYICTCVCVFGCGVYVQFDLHYVCVNAVCTRTSCLPPRTCTCLMLAIVCVCVFVQPTYTHADSLCVFLSLCLPPPQFLITLYLSPSPLSGPLLPSLPFSSYATKTCVNPLLSLILCMYICSCMYVLPQACLLRVGANI